MSLVTNDNVSTQPGSRSSNTSSRSANGSKSAAADSLSRSSRSSSSSMSRSSRSSSSSKSTTIGANSHFLGKEVLINRGGPDSITGLLRKAGSDYIVAQALYSNNQNGNNNNNPNANGNQSKYEIVYIRNSHVKSISLSSQNSVDSYERVPSIINATDFNDVISKLKHQFVQINNNGHEKLDGFIVDASDDSLFLIVDREMIRVSNFHVKSIRVSSQAVGYTGNDNNNNNNNNDNNSNNNKNKNKKNSGSNSKNSASRKSSNNKRRSNSKKNASRKNK